MTDEQNMHRTKVLANAIINRLNHEATVGHVANVVTALQLVVAQVLATYQIEPEVFFARVMASIEVEVHGPAVSG